MEFRAEARFMRVSPQKARLVLDLIKGQRVEDALNTLVFTKKRVAPTSEKLLRSAMENANYLGAEKGIDVDVDNLYVKKAVASDGPRMKRIRPAPMGRTYRYVRGSARRKTSSRRRDGTKGSSLWISPWLHQALEIPLVRRTGLRQAAARRCQVEERAQGQAPFGGRQLD